MGEGLGKLHIKVLLTQRYAGGKMHFSMPGLSTSFVHQQTSLN